MIRFQAPSFRERLCNLAVIPLKKPPRFDVGASDGEKHTARYRTTRQKVAAAQALVLEWFGACQSLQPRWPTSPLNDERMSNMMGVVRTFELKEIGNGILFKSVRMEMTNNEKPFSRKYFHHTMCTSKIFFPHWPLGFGQLYTDICLIYAHAHRHSSIELFM